MQYTILNIDWAKEGYDLSKVTTYARNIINMSYYTSSFIILETFEQTITRLLKEYDLSTEVAFYE